MAEPNYTPSLHYDNIALFLSRSPNMSTEKSIEQAFCSTPPRKKLADHPFIKSIESGQFTLLYGLEVHREAIRNKTFEKLGTDVQSRKLTIDNFNNPCLGLFSNRRQSIEHILTGDHQIDGFIREHIDNLRRFTDVKDLRSLTTDETPIIHYACQSAISTCQRHDIKIFFILDGIDWDELSGRYKDHFTTQELRYLLSEYQKSPSNIEHVTFVQSSCIVDTSTIMEQLDASLRVVRRTATHSTYGASDDSDQSAPPSLKRYQPAKLTFHRDPLDVMHLSAIDMGASAAPDESSANPPPSLMGLSFRLFNTPPSDAATAAARSTTASPDIPLKKP